MTGASALQLLGPYLYGLLIAFPFVIWAARSVYARAQSGDGPYPGHGRTLWFVLLPLTFIACAILRGFNRRTGLEPWQADERGQVLFLLVWPFCGLILGYALGCALARFRGRGPRDRAAGL